MHKYGLKLWSTNDYYINEAKRLYDEGYYNFIELYTVPDSYSDFIKLWKNFDIPFIIHAPHFGGGLKISKREFLDNNLKLADEAKKFADDLDAEFIIFHPGIDGKEEEAVYQINKINDNRILVENKPYYVYGKKQICNGYSPEQIKFIVKNTNTGFCFDVGHCFCAAVAQGIEQIGYLKEFLSLNPVLFHLTDGDYDGINDRHYNFGKGTYDIKKIFELISDSSKITIETLKNSKENLDDFKDDIIYLNKLTGIRA